MRKALVALSVVALMLAPTTAFAGTADDAPTVATADPGVSIGGDYGTSSCYVTLDYFRVDVSIAPVFPFVTVNTYGSVGGEVHCPLAND